MDRLLRLEVTREDRAQLRIVSAADPLEELAGAAHRLALGRRVDAPAAGWARRTAEALGPAGALIMAVMNSGMVICSDLAQHRQRFDDEFDGLADSIRAV
jgi:hypothetical protein